jgi:protein Tob/BTG
MDTVIEKAASMSGVTFADLYKSLPQEFTLWIDPSDVSYRIGEDGSICCLFSTSNIVEEAPSSTVSLTNQSCQAEVPKPMVIRSGSITFTKCLS